jgi:hypothetical protein
MLSILIPTYNCNISNLVLEIHKQATKANIIFEIICFDDCSDVFINENKLTIDSLDTTKIIISEKNLGRIHSRQLLSDAAIYSWLLFLDADVIPKSKKFIENYIIKTNSNSEVIYGGLAYLKDKPNDNSILRWKYGRTYETVNAKKRNVKPFQVLVSGNFLIKKRVFILINSKIKKVSYGLDNYFAALLKQNNIHVSHIDNEVYHLGLENSIVYLKKVEEFIITLLWLYNSKKILDNNNKLLSIFVMVKRFKLNYLMSFFYHVFNLKIKKNLVSHNPNMFLLQLYKILYICHIDLNKKITC